MTAVASLMSSLAVFLFVLWYFRAKNQQEERVRSLNRQQQVTVERTASFSERVAFPLVDGAARTLAAVLPTSLVSRVRRWLVVAGDTVSVSQFFAILLVTSTLLPAVAFVTLWIGSGGSPNLSTLLLLPVLAAFGFLVPLLLLRRRALSRQQKIWRALPNALDLMTTCVEAGLSLDFALQRVAQRYRGPLSDEIQRMLREVALGKTRREALADMAARIDLPDLMTFVNSLAQAETLGTSIGNVLRAQAADLRRRRRQRAEQIARQAPVKMTFPTVFFLMPSLFIVTIGPMILSVIEKFREL